MIHPIALTVSYRYMLATSLIYLILNRGVIVYLELLIFHIQLKHILANWK